MADDRSLKDLIRFLDPSGDITDADIADITKKLKFTEVLDLISFVGKDDLDSARQIVTKYDQRFSIAKEYSTVPTIKPTTATRPMAGTSAQQDDKEQQDLNTLMTDPQTKNRPEVRQIQSLLQRMKR
jgi:ABC-type metal ion transport system substrate-binding protein